MLSTRRKKRGPWGVLPAAIMFVWTPGWAGSGADDFEPQKPEFLEIAETLYGGTNRYLGQAKIDMLREALADPGVPVPQRLNAQAKLVGWLLESGRIAPVASRAVTNTGYAPNRTMVRASSVPAYWLATTPDPRSFGEP